MQLTPQTIREGLGPKFKQIIVLDYPEVLSPPLIADILREVINKPPVNGLGSSLKSEEPPVPLISCVLEFSDGVKRMFQVGKGYAYFVDAAGNSWWGQYA
jgi:hypothetical protein